jgi:hypothetical protein
MTGGIINRINVRVAIVVAGVAIAVGAIAPINSSADNHECADFDGNGRGRGGPGGGRDELRPAIG